MALCTQATAVILACTPGVPCHAGSTSAQPCATGSRFSTRLAGVGLNGRFPGGTGGWWIPVGGRWAGDEQRTQGQETSVGSGVRSQRQIRERTQEG